MALTNIECEKANCPPEAKRLRLYDAHGLYLEVSKTGSKYWRFKYRHDGKEGLLALGVYPSVTLADARKARNFARDELAQGRDPSHTKKERKLVSAQARATTFEKVALAWWEQWRTDKSPRHADYVQRRLSADVFPYIGTLPIGSVTAPQLLAMAKVTEARGATDMAKRALQTCGQIFRYAVVHGLIERSPATDFKPSDALKPTRQENYARIEPKEYPALLRKIDAYCGSPVTRMAMKLMALTFVRTGELIAARWSEFDLGERTWRIPAERMKMKTPHIVPLADQALGVLETLRTITGHSELLFPGERDHAKPMSNNAILAALKRMGYQGRMTGHGFRGLASTILHEQAWAHHLIELQLAHQERNRVAAAYNHATYLAERTRMMQAWADHLDKIRRGADVIPMPKRAA